MSSFNAKPLLHTQHAEVTRTSRKSTGSILFYTACIFVPLAVFSAVLLGLVYINKVGDDPSRGHEVPGGFYLVDFPATRLIFVSSWSSSFAPTLATIATGLYLYHSARAFHRSSSADSSRQPRLPTPYQLALLIGLSTGSIRELWRYTKYKFRKNRSKDVPILMRMSFVLVLFQILG